VLASTLIGVVALSAGGGAAWWLMASQGRAAEATGAGEVDTRAYRYLSLDKVIVMLRKTDGDVVSHYVAMDLVFKTPIDNERVTREHLPMLRSVTVKALSTITLEEATRATVDDLTHLVNAAYTETYANDRAGKPFTEAMIGKLIIE